MKPKHIEILCKNIFLLAIKEDVQWEPLLIFGWLATPALEIQIELKMASQYSQNHPLLETFMDEKMKSDS